MPETSSGQEHPVPRVVMLCAAFPPDFSGAGLQASRLTEALGRAGVTIRVLTTGRAPATPPCSSAAEIRRFRAPRWGQAHGIVFGVRAAWWLLTHSRWDVLHVHGFSLFALLPALVARLRGRPVIVKVTLLGGDDPGSRRREVFGPLLFAVYRRVSAIVALSEEMERTIQEDPSVLAHVYRIPNGVDTDLFRPPTNEERDASRARFRIPRDALVVVTTGAIISRKDPICLLEAAARMRGRPVWILLIGPRDPDPGYAERVDAVISGLPEGVTGNCMGRLSSPEVAEVLWAADVFALNSRAEGFPNSLIEAMATGLPCVATDIPGSRDALSGGGGNLVPVGEPNALADALDRLAESPDQRTRLGRQGSMVVGTRYGMERVARRYLEVYRELMKSISPRRDPSLESGSGRAGAAR